MVSGKRRPPATPTQKQHARELYEQGESLGIIGKGAGVAKSTVSSWAKRSGWSRPEGFDTTAAAKKTAAASSRSEVIWETGKLERANRAARIADILGAMIEAELIDKVTTLALKASTQYGTYIDKARLLADELKADNGGRTPTGSDPAEVRRAIAEIAEMLLPPE